MTMTVTLRTAEDPGELARAEATGFFNELMAFDVGGDPPERSVVRPLAEESGASWRGLLDRAIDASPGAVVGIVSESAAEAATLACELASWSGAAGRAVVVVDGSVEKPVVDKALSEHGDEGLVDVVLFGVSPSVAVRRTLTRGVRVLTAGSHPLAVESVFASDELARVLRELAADTVFVILPRAYLQFAGRLLDVLVAIARDAEGLVGMAREGGEAGIRRGVGVLLCEAEAEAATAAYPEAAAPTPAQAEPVAAQRAGAGTPGCESMGEGSGDGGAPSEGTPVPRRNESIPPERFDSPFLPESRPEAVEQAVASGRSKLRFGFIGWFAIAAIVIIVALTVFDMTLRPKKLAWRGAGTTDAGELPAAAESGVEADEDASVPGDEIEPVSGEAPPGRPGEAGVEDEVRAGYEASDAAGVAEDDERKADEAAVPDRGSAERESEIPVDVKDAVWIEDAVTPGGLHPALPGSGGPYIILLSSHRLRSAAEWDVSQAEARGMAARTMEVELPESGTWYRVALTGGHPSLASARAALDIVRELGYEGAWLVRQ